MGIILTWGHSGVIHRGQSFKSAVIWWVKAKSGHATNQKICPTILYKNKWPCVDWHCHSRPLGRQTWPNGVKMFQFSKPGHAEHQKNCLTILYKNRISSHTLTNIVIIDHGDEKSGQRSVRLIWETWACDTSIDPSYNALQQPITKVWLKLSMLTAVTKNGAKCPNII